MRILNYKNKEKGFTLVELLLIIGLIALASIGIYQKYKKVMTQTNTKLEVQDLYAMTNKIQNAYQMTTSLATLNNTTAIANGLVPQELINSPNIISRYGGTITLTPQTVNSLPGFEIKINNIRPEDCSAIGTSDFADKVDEVFVASSLKKTTGAQLTSANRASIISACSSATDISFRKQMVYNTNPDSYLQTRTAQTDKYYIPSIKNNVTSVSPSCSGGSTFSAANGSFCSCPAGTEWNGSACTSITLPTNCGYGLGGTVGSYTCTALPVTKTSETFYNGTAMVTQPVQFYNATAPATRAACDAISGYWDPVTNICGGIVPTQQTSSKTAPTPVYQAGRYIPQAMNTQVTNELPSTYSVGNAAQCTSMGGNWDGKQCNICPAPSTIGSVNTAIVNVNTNTQIGTMANNPSANPKTVAGHAATSTWNVDRCVTPAASAAPPYPQTVTW